MKILPLILGLLTVPLAASLAESSLQPLRVGDNYRFLVAENGKPFFWLSDTAWDLRMLKPAEVDLYMTNRVRHGFNVVPVWDWKDSLNAAGATQMKLLRALLESRPFLARVSDQTVIAGDTPTGNEHLQATRDVGGPDAMVYSPLGHPFKVRTEGTQPAKRTSVPGTQ